MSKCYYLENDKFIELDEVLGFLQKRIVDNFTVKLEPFDASEGDGGHFYIEGNGIRGVQLFYEAGRIVVQINILANYSDFIIAKLILETLGLIFNKQFIDEAGNAIQPNEYFTNEMIQELREHDAKIVLATLKSMMYGTIEMFGIVRRIYFGKRLTQELIKYENDSELLVRMFEGIFYHIQYGLPNYSTPSAAIIRKKGSDDERTFVKVRMLFEGNSYILQDYDYLMIHPDKSTEEIIFINYEDLSEIAPKIFKENSGFEFSDDFTVVFPKLEETDWKQFVALAREKNHQELSDTEFVEEINNSSAEDNSETTEDDEYSKQCHGNHWECILAGPTNDFPEILTTAFTDATRIIGDVQTDFTLEEESSGRIIELEYSKTETEPLSIKFIVCAIDDSMQLVSMYPCVREGAIIPLKITEIEEWKNGLEAWITGELEDERFITFFDTDYAVNKDTYEIGKIYNFIIGGLAYFAKEPESKGFKFEGQQAIDFKAKLGEAPEYDEGGNVIPIEFSTESLCVFIQSGDVPDDAEFITTVDNIKTVEALGNDFWNFDIIYRGEEYNEVKIPTFVLKSKENMSLDTATQLQGYLWLTGYLSK